jgi:hypothetical protein
LGYRSQRTLDNFCSGNYSTSAFSTFKTLCIMQLSLSWLNAAATTEYNHEEFYLLPD